MAISTTEPLSGNPTAVAAVVLAAGEGSRFAGDDHKLLTLFRGRPLAAWALDAALDAGYDRVYLVTGAVDLSPVVDRLSDDRLARVVVVPNPDYAAGQATSLAAGIDAAAAGGAEAVVVGLADQPGVPASAWRAVGAAAGPIVSATFDNKRRPPVRLHKSVWGELPRSGDDGARILFRVRPELVSELPCLGNAFDIDTEEDLHRWN